MKEENGDRLYLILKRFSFNNEFDRVNQFISNREKWISKQ